VLRLAAFPPLNATLMSRGHGKLQRRLLEILNSEARVFGTFELATRAFDVPPRRSGPTLITAAQEVAARRALRKLADEGAVNDLRYAGRRKAWANESDCGSRSA
jgi:hypothetical protein